jgi:hypothetical protein
MNVIHSIFQFWVLIIMKDRKDASNWQTYCANFTLNSLYWRSSSSSIMPFVINNYHLYLLIPYYMGTLTDDFIQYEAYQQQKSIFCHHCRLAVPSTNSNNDCFVMTDRLRQILPPGYRIWNYNSDVLNGERITTKFRTLNTHIYNSAYRTWALCMCTYFCTEMITC